MPEHRADAIHPICKQTGAVVEYGPTIIIYSMSTLLSAVSIIVPTFREAPNLKPLVERTFAALAESNRTAELIIVDDNSQDGTDAVVEELQTRFPVRLIVREAERGLSSAVLTGFCAAENDIFVVMDADLQHPPEMIPALLERMEVDACDFVLGTRYSTEATVADDWPWIRRLASRVATWLARPLVPMSDPMSGFFALRRATWQGAKRINPIGYKIALELVVKSRCRKPGEVPIEFETRVAGSSKLSAGVQFGYLAQLMNLYWFRFPVLTAILLLIGLAGVVGLAFRLARAVQVI